MKETIAKLEQMYEMFNDYFYEGNLPKCIITVQSNGKNKSTLGWCTVNKVWSDEMYEINISAEYLNRGKDEVIGTLLHEMVHLYCRVNDIKDTSRNFKYHNKMFKQIAEEHGLIIEHDTKIGWSLTTLKPQTIEKFKDLEWNIDLSRVIVHNQSKTRKMYVYVCPTCGEKIRSLKPLNIICEQCDCKFETNLK